MQKCNFLLVSLVPLLISACATSTEKSAWTMVGGSKADGDVILGIDVPPKMWVTETNVVWDAAQANKEATDRCQAWGYKGAKVYRENLPVLKTCYSQGVSPCWSKTYRVQYQCVSK